MDEQKLVANSHRIIRLSRYTRSNNMLKPLNDNVIVKPSNAEEKTASGIIIPDTVNKEKPEQGEIIAVGPGKLNDSGVRMPLNVKVGDKVFFTKYAPNEFKVKDETFLVMKEDDILAVVE